MDKAVQVLDPGSRHARDAIEQQYTLQHKLKRSSTILELHRRPVRSTDAKTEAVLGTCCAMSARTVQELARDNTGTDLDGAFLKVFSAFQGPTYFFFPPFCF